MFSKLFLGFSILFHPFKDGKLSIHQIVPQEIQIEANDEVILDDYEDQEAIAMTGDISLYFIISGVWIIITMFQYQHILNVIAKVLKLLTARVEN